MLKWIRNKSKRDIIAFVGGGIAVVAGGAWTVFTYFADGAATREQLVAKREHAEPMRDLIEATYTVCIGSDSQRCPQNSVWLRCGTTVADWAKKECSQYSDDRVSASPGGACGWIVVQVKCTNSR